MTNDRETKLLADNKHLREEIADLKFKLNRMLYLYQNMKCPYCQSTTFVGAPDLSEEIKNLHLSERKVD